MEPYLLMWRTGQRSRKLGRALGLITLLATLSLSSVATAQPDSGGPSEADIVTQLVASLEDHCAEVREAIWASASAVEAYVRCAAPVFAQTLRGTDIVAQLTGLRTRLHALDQACLALDKSLPAPVGCSAQDYCVGCPDLPVRWLLEQQCQFDRASCHSAVTGVEHVETRLDAICGGTLKLHDGRPKEIKFGSFGGGTVEYFHWSIVSQRNISAPTEFHYRCDGQPAVEGRAWGGFMRALDMWREGMRPFLCRYDGLTEDECVGSFEADETIGYYGFAEAGGAGPPDVVQLDHEAGWVLLNRGQGSTNAIKTFDPNPAEIPAASARFKVKYEVLDLRTAVIEEQRAPAAAGLLGPLVAVAWLVVVSRRQPRSGPSPVGFPASRTFAIAEAARL